MNVGKQRCIKLDHRIYLFDIYFLVLNLSWTGTKKLLTKMLDLLRVPDEMEEITGLLSFINLHFVRLLLRASWHFLTRYLGASPYIQQQIYNQNNSLITYSLFLIPTMIFCVHFISCHFKVKIRDQNIVLQKRNTSSLSEQQPLFTTVNNFTTWSAFSFEPTS